MKTTVYGFPKMGANRETKKAVEAYWKGEITQEALVSELKKIENERIMLQKQHNVTYTTSGDFSSYDFVLDTAVMFGIIPDRFGAYKGLDTTYGIARGTKDAIAAEMTKWFDTNYHYIVPEISKPFKLLENRPLNAYRAAKEELGAETKPYILGAFTLIYLSKVNEKAGDLGVYHLVPTKQSSQFKNLVLEIAKLYNQVLKELDAEGVATVQIDEPAFVLDLDAEDIAVIKEAYATITSGLKNLKVHLQTYYESVSHYNDIVNLPVAAIGFDLVSNTENSENIKKGYPKDKQIILGVVGGRDIWKTDINAAIKVVEYLGLNKDQVILGPSCPMFHLPFSLAPEKGHLDNELLGVLAFATERLYEIELLQKHFSGVNVANEIAEYVKPIAAAQSNTKFVNKTVRDKVNALKEADFKRPQPFSERRAIQDKEFNLPLFPTTTIGSFPQDATVRKTRADYRAKRISEAEYETFIKNQIQSVVKLQEDLDIDVLVHGEFERTDMVEFFGEKLNGFAFTKNGWVQSYGSRCVKPPVIFGDVDRPNPMTIKEIAYAQTLTKRVMKGMLTGPVTIINWSFYRKDIPKYEIAYQLGLALQDELTDYEKSGIRMVQIDEAAFREGLPLKKSKQAAYLDWAVKSFRLCSAHVKPQTQIHTHMCYSEFNTVMKSIYDMDADVISIEASRSQGEILEAFEKLNYDHGIGLGVYDIHSPRVPNTDEMVSIAERAIKVIDKKLFWVNPDCGLKTRGYAETKPALANMVETAKKLRAKYAK